MTDFFKEFAAEYETAHKLPESKPIITITVNGVSGSGKSTISAFLIQCLQAHGFEVKPTQVVLENQFNTNKDITVHLANVSDMHRTQNAHIVIDETYKRISSNTDTLRDKFRF